ncbi:MAG: TRAP transporter small permease [Spirochaetales bacterium]
MTKLKKALKILLDIIEIYLPMATFSALFIAFILQIVSRYIFRRPLVWPYELSQFGYLWTIMLGACYTSRNDSHIVFSIAYEAASPNVKKIYDIINYSLTIIFFSIPIPATIKFYQFYMTRYSAVFNFPLGIIYFGFVPFVLITICRSAARLVKCLSPKKAEGKNKEARA